MRADYELKRLERTKRYLQALIDDNAPQADIDDARTQVNRWQREYDYKVNKLFNYIDDKEEQNIINIFFDLMDRMIAKKEYNIYNNPNNDYQHVYALLKDEAYDVIAPDLNSTKKNIETYNIIIDSIPELLKRYIKSRYNNIKD